MTEADYHAVGVIAEHMPEADYRADNVIQLPARTTWALRYGLVAIVTEKREPEEEEEIAPDEVPICA